MEEMDLIIQQHKLTHLHKVIAVVVHHVQDMEVVVVVVVQDKLEEIQLV